MHQSTSSRKALGLALLLVTALMFQSFPMMRTSVVAARGGSPTPGSPAGQPGWGGAVSSRWGTGRTALAWSPVGQPGWGGAVREGATTAPVEATKDITTNEWLPQPQPAPTLAPEAAVIAATLSDNVTAATKVAPGGVINYTATITNNGAATPADDATNLNFSAPLDANTTLVAGSVHASPIAFNDTYNWVGNTQLDTVARALPAVTTNDVAVNAPTGADTFTVTAIAGGASSLGGVVTLASPSGSFVYTPPVGRPNLVDGATVQDSFTYTITNNADPSLTSTGTVRINLTGRVWYLQAGAAGDGRSNTPSSSPSAMSTAADKSSDIFYIFSNAGSLNGLFTVDAGQQLLGQGVGLTVSSISLFSAAAPTPTTTNTAGNCVTLAGAPGNNTLSGFNIGNCTGGTAIAGSNVGTLAINTMSINTNGGGLDLTGVGAPTATISLTSLTSSGGTKNVNLVGLNGTIGLGSGALSGASGNAFDVSAAGNAIISYSGTIGNTTARSVNVASKNAGSVLLSGAVSGSGTGISLTSNTGAVINFTGGINLSTGANAAFTATGGGTVSATQNNTTIVNTLTTTTGTPLTVTSTTISGLGFVFRSISTNGGASGIILNSTGTSGGLTVTGDGTGVENGSGGLITNTTGFGINLTTTRDVSLTQLRLSNTAGHGINTSSVTNFTYQDASIVNAADGNDEQAINLLNTFGTSLIEDVRLDDIQEDGIQIRQNVDPDANNTTFDTLTIRRLDVEDHQAPFGESGIEAQVDGASSLAVVVDDSDFALNTNAVIGCAMSTAASFTATGRFKFTVQNSTFDGSNAFGSGSIQALGGGLGTTTYLVTGNTITNTKFDGIRINNDGGHTNATITNNDVDGSTSPVNNGEGITCRQDENGTMTILISGNDMTQIASNQIRIQGSDKTIDDAIVDVEATITNNTGTVTPASGFGAGLLVDVGDGSGVAKNDVRINVSGNNLDGTETTPFFDFDITLNLNETSGASLRVTQASDAALSTANNANSVSSFANPPNTITYSAGTPPTPPLPAANPDDESALNTTSTLDNNMSFLNTSYQSLFDVREWSVKSGEAANSGELKVASRELEAKTGIARPAETAGQGAWKLLAMLGEMISPTAYAQDSVPNAPTSGEVVSLNTIATFPAGGKSITIKYSATVNAPPNARQVATQGTVTATGGISVLTDDPEPAGAANPTVTLVDTLLTWNGVTNTDWNTITNWTQPAGGTQYAPGVSNPAVNDVVIPNVGNQPNISATDIGVFSLNISNGRTLTITSPRVLTIGGSPGGDLTLDGIISGGNLNLGTGTHVINNAGGTGSLSATNVATVLSGSTVTLNNNLQAGALAVNAGGSMNITNRTLSLNGSGAALTIPGGATFTTTGSTVVFNGTAAQTAAGIAYNNLTINNTLGLNVTGVTLQGNATVNGVLTLTSSDLDTGAFTLTMPTAATSGPATNATDVIGNVKRTGFVSGGAALSFGNPFNTIRINSGAAPTDINVNLVKSSPVGFSQSVQRTYTITPNGANGPATLRLHYLDTELNGNTPETGLNLRRFTGTVWSPVLATSSNTGDTTNNWLENNNVVTFSPWTFSTFNPTASNSSISGILTNPDGSPLGGVVLQLNNGRRTITRADGKYRFDEVPTGDFYTLIPLLANHHFNPAARSFSLTGNMTNADFGAAGNATENANPLDTDMYFVRQQYLDFLGREPDEGGLQYWTSRISECADDQECMHNRRLDVSAAFFGSAEFQQTGSYVYGLYAGTLGRTLNHGEFGADRSQVLGGAGLDEAKTAFAEAFVQRPEFTSRYPQTMSREQFVDAVLQTMQQRSGVDHTALRAGMLGDYDTGGRGLVIRHAAEADAFVSAEYNKAFVLMEYFGYLRRPEDGGGYAFWLDVLNNGAAGNYRGMVCSFLTSTEYQIRFSTVVTHSNADCGP